jgi:amidase
VAVKDTEDVAGEPTRWGTAIRARPAERDNDLVSRLRGAGAVLIGKTNLPELAIMGATEGPAFGVTRNPWDTDRTPGGSSGGSAAAVAAGLCAAATASDGAGSIRIPASCCGLVGLKPQRDRVSLGALAGHWKGMSVAGFLTRSVEDTALLLDVAADRKPERPYTESSREEPEKLRVALSFKACLSTRPGTRGRAELAAGGGGNAAKARSRGGRARPRLRPCRRCRERALPDGHRRGRDALSSA